MLPVEQPFKIYTGLDGKPLDGGYVYFGLPNQEPRTHPVTVYWDAAGTIPAVQPLRTVGGYIIRGGTPANVFFDGSYSELAQDSKERQVFYARTSEEFSLAGQIANLFAATGSSLVGFIQPGTGAVKQSVQAVLRALRVTPQQFGAAGNGTTVDTGALKAMFATGRPWYIPYTPGGYLFDETLTVSADGECDGFLLARNGFSTLAINFADPGYGTRRLVRGLEVRPTTARVAGSIGFRLAYPNIVLDRCRAGAFDYGYQVWSYSIALLNCIGQQCKTNVSMYAPSSSQEINDVKIIGGNYDSATEYAMRVGDPRFTSAVAAGNPHGVNILIDGANFDGATVTIDRVFSLKMRSYHEGAGSGNAIELGGSGNNNLRNIVIGAGSYFARYDHAIYLKNSVMGLVVESNQYAVNYCALYAVNCDVAGFTYRKGTSNGFSAPEVHTGFTNTSVSALTFADITIERDGLSNGVQIAQNRTSTDNWYPNGRTLDGWVNLSSSTGRFHNVVQNVNGVQAGDALTCNIKSEATKFNGGDRVRTSLGGVSFVRYVDYVAGVIYLDGSASGATLLTHGDAAFFLGDGLSGSGSPEGVVTAPKGSTYRNLSATGSGLYVKDSGSGNTGWAGK